MIFPLRQGRYTDFSEETVPEFLTGREFLKFFLDIHENRIADKANLDSREFKEKIIAALREDGNE